MAQAILKGQLSWVGSNLLTYAIKGSLVSNMHCHKLKYGVPRLTLVLGAGKNSVKKITVKSQAVDWSTIQFWTNFGVLLTETCYYCHVPQSNALGWYLKQWVAEASGC